MAQGDIVVFNSFKLELGSQFHDLLAAGDVIKLAFTTSSGTTPTATTALPHWGGTGTTNLNAAPAEGGNYTADGHDIVNTWTASGATMKFDGTDLATFDKNASNPSDIRWGIFYNSTDASKRCIAFLDLGAVVDGTAGDLTITFNASGIFTLA